MSRSGWWIVVAGVIAVVAGWIVYARSGGEPRGTSGTVRHADTVEAQPSRADGSPRQEVSLPGGRSPTAPAPPRMPGAASDDQDLRENRLVDYGPGSLRSIPARYELVTFDRYVVVNLAGGRPATTLAPYGPSRPRPEGREIRGRVLDPQGRPVIGAIVLVDDIIHSWRGEIVAPAGTITGADGTFTIANGPEQGAETRSVAIAFDPSGWSDVIPVGAAPLELRLRGRGALHGKLSYDGHAETFTIDVSNRDRSFRVAYQSEPDGTFEIASLPVGSYEVSVGLAQAIAGGSSQRTKREITIEASATKTIEIDQRSSAIVVVTTTAPEEVELELVEVFLLPGSSAPDPAEARALVRTDGVRYLLFGGVDAPKPIQFHDVDAGAYTVCAAVNRELWGCVPMIVVDGDVVREAQVRAVARPQ